MAVVTNDYEIANLALDHLHLTQKIGSLNDSTEQARTAKRWYEIVRLALLKSYWRFAEKRVVLVKDTVAANAHPDWTFAFTPPADMLKAIGFLPPGYRRIPADWRVPFEVANLPDGSARRIYSDYDPPADARFLYVYNATTVNLFPDHFVAVFAVELALKMAPALRPSVEVLKGLVISRPTVWAEARTDEAGDKVDAPPDASWILARR